MSEILLGVLSMPDALFWDDEPITRMQHNSIRLEAAAQLHRMEKMIEALEWYEKQLLEVRKHGPEGDAARHALSNDRGERARLALS